MNNAIKFTDSGSITVSCRLIDPLTIKLEVIDTGCGIDQKNFGLLFEEFSQLSDKNKENRKTGTGLGLSISKKIVEAQKGRIYVESKLGKGSKFTVEIPYQVEINAETTDEEKGPDNKMLEVVDWTNLPIKKVLLVDDNILNIKLLKLILERHSIICDHAENGELAYQLFLNNNYDAVLTDLEMPVLNGIDLTKKIRSYDDKSKSGTPILPITATALADDWNEYAKIGINGHLLKPFTEQTLYHSLRKLVIDRNRAA